LKYELTLFFIKYAGEIIVIMSSKMFGSFLNNKATFDLTAFSNFSLSY